jgi:hypothetical protein
MHPKRREIATRARQTGTGDNGGVGTPAFVGRQDVLGRMSRVLDEACAGIGRLVLVSGEPGVGKTRLALEVLAEADRRGARSAVGACWEGAGAPGLWPWVQVLRSLRADLDEDREALALLLDGNEPGAPTEFHVFEAILQLLDRLCADRPLVVLLDDLQWADGASLSLMGFLHQHAVHLPLLIVGTYRTDEVARTGDPEQLAVADLAQKAVAIPLRGLDNDAIRDLRGNLGATTSTAEAEHLRRLTGGNPFFVIESVAFDDPTASLGVRRAIDRRIGALGEREREVLTVASLIGREAPDELVARVIGDAGGAAAAFGEIERTGLMRADDGQHVFEHDLVRESLRDALSSDDRRALYARIVRAADAQGDSTRLLPAQLAWLATQAVPDIPPSEAVALLESAAHHASAGLTHEAAARHLDEAAALAEDADERTRLVLASGDAHHRAGSLGLARDRFSSLLDAPQVEVRARALLGLHQLGDPAAVGERSDLLQRLDAFDDELCDVALRAEVLAARSRSRSHLLSADRSEAASMAAEALHLARSDGSDATVSSCLLAYHDAIWEPGKERERQALAEDLVGIGRRLADPAVEAQGLLLRMVAEIELGDPTFLATHRRFDEIAEASRSARLRFLAASRRGTVAALRADLAAAQVEIDAARALGERIGEPDAVGMWCDQRWQLARHAGDHGAIVELIETLRLAGDPHWMVYEVVSAADRGDADRARQHREDVIALGERWPRWAARLWDVITAQLAALEQDGPRIADLVERLEPDAGSWAVLGGGVLVHGPVAYWLGRLEAARGDRDRALTWFTEAETAAHRLDAPLWWLEARADRLIAQNAVGTADEAEIASTVAAARDLGLQPIIDRLQALAPTAPSSRNVFRRDRDVWTLAFDGVEIRLPDAKGLRDLRTLLANPGVEVPATSLATESYISADRAPVLDARAKAEYRRRLDDIDRELDRAAVRGDAARAAGLEDEREALLAELRKAAGLGGRDRSTNDHRERIRKAVTARIRDTLRRLDDRHPELAGHLRTSVRTGASCVYAPASPTKWDVGPAPSLEADG